MQKRGDDDENLLTSVVESNYDYLDNKRHDFNSGYEPWKGKLNWNAGASINIYAIYRANTDS